MERRNSAELARLGYYQQDQLAAACQGAASEFYGRLNATRSFFRRAKLRKGDASVCNRRAGTSSRVGQEAV